MIEKRTRILPPSGGVRPPGFSDIDAAEKAGLTVPPAADSGGQTGRVPPAVRKITANYEAVDMATASARMIARQKGEMPAIHGGLDGPGQVDADKVRRHRGGAMPDVPGESVEEHDTDSPNAAPGPAPSMDPMALQAMLSQLIQSEFAARRPVPVPVPQPSANDQLMGLLSKLVAQGAPQPGPMVTPHFPSQVELNPFNPGPLIQPVQEVPQPMRAQVRQDGTLQMAPAVQYLAQRSRVSFTVPGGTYSIPAVDVQPCSSGLVILLPMDRESATFVPSLGAEVVVDFGGKRWECFFPGVAVQLEALGVQVLSFVYQNDRQAT